MDKRIKTTDDVIVASHIVIRDGMVPTRIVIRKLDNEFAVHIETLKTRESERTYSCALEHIAFEQGGYFRWGENIDITENHAYELALASFEQRASRL